MKQKPEEVVEVGGSFFEHLQNCTFEKSPIVCTYTAFMQPKYVYIRFVTTQEKKSGVFGFLSSLASKPLLFGHLRDGDLAILKIEFPLFKRFPLLLPLPYPAGRELTAEDLEPVSAQFRTHLQSKNVATEIAVQIVDSVQASLVVGAGLVSQAS